MDEADLLRGVQRLLRRAIPWTVEEGFVPERDAEPRPIGGLASRSTGAPNHAHRKPIRRRASAGSGSRR
jgi:hypothetical protein